LNPGLVVEVLSPSTASYDRGDKFVHYRKIDSLHEVLFIAQDCILIEHWRRQGDMWTLTEITGVDDTLMLNSVGCAIPVQEIYSRLDVSEGPGNS
jgi:Uma2 family endonuclease